MMTEGTKKRTSLGLAEAVEALGTSLEQSAGRDFVRLGMTTLRENLKDGLALLSEVVKEPQFALQSSSACGANGSTHRSGAAELAALGSRRSSGVAGTTAEARQRLAPRRGGLKRKDLVDYYGQNFVAGNLALVVVGGVTLADVAAAGQLFGSSRGEGRAGLALLASRARAARADRRSPGAVRNALFVRSRFRSARADRASSRTVFSVEVRVALEPRCAKPTPTYGATSLDMATRGWGAFAVMTSVRTDVTGAALKEARAELQKARDPGLGRPISEGEVATSRALLEQRLGTSLSHTAEVAERVEELFIHDLPSDYLQKYPTVLDATTPTAIANEAKRLDPDHAVIVVVGASKFEND